MNRNFKIEYMIFKKAFASIFLLLVICLIGSPAVAQSNTLVQLKWLGEKAPGISTGVSFGVPFSEGQVQTTSAYLLKDSNGHSMDVQSWPMAYWPDGSLKWVGMSTAVDTESGSSFQLQPTEKAESIAGSQTVEVIETDDRVNINTGVLQCAIPRQGSRIISSLKIDNREVSSGGELLCILQNGPEKDLCAQPEKEKLTGRIEKVTVEQAGPVRSVVKIEGTHLSESGTRAFLPFIVRFYFYAGQQSIKMVHTIIYDGDQHTDFIRGLGVVFDVPMDDELYNRHIRFSGENGGLWVEPVEPLTGRRTLSREVDYYAKQINGEQIPQRESFSDRQKFLLDNWASCT